MPLVKARIILLLLLLVRQVSAGVGHGHVSGAFFRANDWKHGRLFLRLEKLKGGGVGRGAEELRYLAILFNSLPVFTLPLLFNSVSRRLIRVLFTLEALLKAGFFSPRQVQGVQRLAQVLDRLTGGLALGLGELLDLVLQGDLVVSGLMDHLMEDQVLFSQVRHAVLRLLPLVLPKLHRQCFIFRVQKRLSVAHLENLIDRLLLHLLLLGRSLLDHFDLLLGDHVSPVKCLALLHVGFFERLDAPLFSLHHT